MIVDDTVINLRVARGLLKPTGANVAVCKSGMDCLQLMKKKSFDLVFMDHMMPEMDGIETLQAAKESPDIDTEKVVFIALTANAVTGIRDTFIEAGFDDYLSKPINTVKMEELIKTYCLNS